MGYRTFSHQWIDRRTTNQWIDNIIISHRALLIPWPLRQFILLKETPV